MAIKHSTRTDSANVQHRRALFAWCALIQRCRNPRHKNYASYGGRGIGFCDRWRTFANFLADMGDPPLGFQLDRIDNDGHYEPGNCRWATRKQNMNNTRRTVRLTIGGRTMTLHEWADLLGIAPRTLGMRVERGWPEHRLLEPKQKRKLTLDQVFDARAAIADGASLRSVSKSLGVAHRTMRRAIDRLEACA